MTFRSVAGGEGSELLHMAVSPFGLYWQQYFSFSYTRHSINASALVYILTTKYD